jgi:L-iditol 2-dehydrogenase
MYYSNNDIRIEEMPVPEVGPEEILIRIEASGICGSDIMEWYRRDKVPLVLGHEIAGEIVKTGNKVKNFKKGQRVSASHHVPCNECHYCLSGHSSVCDLLRKTKFHPGGFAEYVLIPSINIEKKGVYLLPENISYEEGSFSEPVACVLRAQKQIRVKKGKSVLVIGSGISGLLHVMLARALGASPIMATDVSEYKLNMAKESGADVVMHSKSYNTEQFRKLNSGRLADIVILCAGAPAAIYQAIDSVERGGTLLVFAAMTDNADINFPVNKIFWRNEITIVSSYANHPSEQVEALELISSGRMPVRKLITHRFGLEDTSKGFKLLAEGRDCVKVIIEPQK